MTTPVPADVPLNERRYAVVTNSVREPGKIMARVAPPDAGRGNFWTTTEIDKVWAMDGKTADEIAARLVLNNPQVMRYERAIGKLKAQMAVSAPTTTDDPAPEPDF